MDTLELRLRFLLELAPNRTLSQANRSVSLAPPPSRTRGHGQGIVIVSRYAWRRDPVPRDGFDVRTARDLHDDVEVVPQVFEHALNAQIPSERKAVEDRPAASDNVGPERERAEHVGTAADAAVEDDRHPALDR